MDPRSPVDSSHLTKCTLKSGAPIGNKLNSLLLGSHGPNLLADVAYIEETAHFNRERIPERVVHAKGATAYGQFVVTDSNEISKYSKAEVFKKTGNCTPVVARFSHVTGESGISDTLRDVRGFAIKFYTKAGNWDLVGNNFPVFFIRDPINFSSFIHSQKRNPRTHLRDPDAFWDFVTQLPESLHTITMLFSERGIPSSFRHMHGYGVNTFKLVNDKNQSFYAKFHWICQQEIKNLTSEQADTIAGQDPDYLLRDLYINIVNGNFPRWTLKFQVMTVDQAESAKFNVFDVTKTWPMAQYPLHEIGQMSLEQNPDNYFAQVEQLAFSPSNLIPGIEASEDKMLVGRMFSYPDAQRYRLGANYADLPCNQPKCPVFTPTYCDNVTFMSNINGSLPNYVPSCRYRRLNLEDKQFVEHPEHFSANVGRFDLSNDDNYTQVRALILKVLNDEGRSILINNLVQHLKLVANPDIIKKVISNYEKVDRNFSQTLNGALMRADN